LQPTLDTQAVRKLDALRQNEAQFGLALAVVLRFPLSETECQASVKAPPARRSSASLITSLVIGASLVQPYIHSLFLGVGSVANLDGTVGCFVRNLY
jgi:hypothetical protein